MMSNKNDVSTTDPTENEEILFTPLDGEDKVDNAGALSEKAEEVLRIEEVVGRRWSGVASCGHSDRIQQEAQTALNEWIQKKLFEYRNLRYIRAGSGEGRARWSTNNPPFGARSCSGSLTMPCYIEFNKA
jgi:hypothetical protein